MVCYCDIGVKDMKNPAKTPRTIGATSRPSHCDSGTLSPRSVPCWPDQVVTPPFLIRECIGIPLPEVRKTAPDSRSLRDIGAVIVTLLDHGVTRENGTRLKTWFSATDAAAIAMDYVRQDLPGVDMLHIFPDRTLHTGEHEPLALNSWRAVASAHKWSVMPFPVLGRDAIGVFRTRAVRDRYPAWLWHHLGASLLVPKSAVIHP